MYISPTTFPSYSTNGGERASFLRFYFSIDVPHLYATADVEETAALIANSCSLCHLTRWHYRSPASYPCAACKGVQEILFLVRVWGDLVLTSFFPFHNSALRSFVFVPVKQVR